MASETPSRNQIRPEYRAFWGLRPRVIETGNESSSQRYKMWDTNFRD